MKAAPTVGNCNLTATTRNYGMDGAISDGHQYGRMSQVATPASASALQAARAYPPPRRSGLDLAMAAGLDGAEFSRRVGVDIAAIAVADSPREEVSARWLLVATCELAVLLRKGAMNVRITKKLAEVVDGIDISHCSEGDVVALPEKAAQLLIAEQWAEEASPDIVPTCEPIVAPLAASPSDDWVDLIVVPVAGVGLKAVGVTHFASPVVDDLLPHRFGPAVKRN